MYVCMCVFMFAAGGWSPAAADDKERSGQSEIFHHLGEQ